MCYIYASQVERISSALQQSVRRGATVQLLLKQSKMHMCTYIFMYTYNLQ